MKQTGENPALPVRVDTLQGFNNDVRYQLAHCIQTLL
jgi:hypothetical protein